MQIKNLSIIRHSFANTVFTHKVQEVAAEYQEKKIFYIKIINIVLVSLVLITLFFQILNPEKLWIVYIGAGIGIIEIVFLIIQLTFNFEKRMDSHKNSALKFLDLRESYKYLISDIVNNCIDQSTLIERRELLKKQYQTICEISPQTGRKEFYEAQKRLNKNNEKDGEDFTWSEEEIDRFLPESLRLYH